MRLIDELLTTSPDGSVRDIQVGAFRTAVLVGLGSAIGNHAKRKDVERS